MRTVLLGVVAGISAMVLASTPTLSGQAPGGSQGAGGAPRDWSRDMAMTIHEPFTLASVGDVIIVRPTSMTTDPGVQAALEVFGGADVGFGNFESLIRDQRTFDGPLGGSMMGTREVAADLKAMGFTMMSRAGNHLFDSGQEGLVETMRLMDEAGIVHAGAGRNLDEARAPRFADTPKGRVGLVSMYGETGTGQSRLSATYRVGVTGGRPGLNPLRVTRAITVSPEQIESLKLIKAAVYERRTQERSNAIGPPAADPANQIEFFGTRYREGTKPGELSYAMNTADLEANLASVKNGKAYSDFMIATIHAHQGDTLFQPFLFEDRPPDFLVALARASIDAGADAFVGHGPHLLRGIEIYKGKPIFYNLGEFFRQWDWSCDCNFSPDGNLTQAEAVVANHTARGVDEPVNYESVIAMSHFDSGVLQEIRLYPIWGGLDAPLSKRDLPALASPEIAQRILTRLQSLSEPFGTRIAIEGNVGVIRVSGPATTAAR